MNLKAELTSHWLDTYVKTRRKKKKPMKQNKTLIPFKIFLLIPILIEFVNIMDKYRLFIFL